MAYNFYGAVSLTGGSDGALDKIDGSVLADGDGAIVVDATNNIIYHYTLDSGSGAAESSPDIVSPDTNAGTKRWILVAFSGKGGALRGAELLIDADGDSSLTADTDDQLDLKLAGADQIYFKDGSIEPATDNDIDLGAAGKEFKDLFIDGTANIDSLTLSSGTTVNEFSTDDNMTGNSDFAVPTEKSVVGYVALQPKRNEIENGQFNVWQRGTGTFSSAGYTADRWKLGLFGDSCNVDDGDFTPGQTDVPYATKYLISNNTYSAGAGNATLFIHTLDGIQRWAGQTCTLSFYAKAAAGTPDLSFEIYQDFGVGGSATVTGQGVFKSTLSTSWAQYSASIGVASVSGKTIGTNPTTNLVFWQSAGSDYDSRTDTLGQQSYELHLANVNFTLGNRLTSWEPRPYSEEIALCQRYYIPDLSYFFSGGVSSGQTYYQKTTLPVKMRTTPTIAATHGGSSGFAASAPTFSTITDSYVITDKVATGTVVGYYYGTFVASADF